MSDVSNIKQYCNFKPHTLCAICRKHRVVKGQYTCNGQRCIETKAKYDKLMQSGFDPEWVKQFLDCNHNFVDSQVLVYVQGKKPYYKSDKICTICKIAKSTADKVASCLT